MAKEKKTEKKAPQKPVKKAETVRGIYSQRGK